MALKNYNIDVFDKNAVAYDAWYDEHPAIYKSELKALKLLVPPSGRGLEVGGGTGRFAAPLGIKTIVEPSVKMAEIARMRGLEVIEAHAESLSFSNESFDFALFANTLCFLPNIPDALKETWRVLRPKGKLIIALIDSQSPLGRKYQNEKLKNAFYKEANFLSVVEVEELLRDAGFTGFQYYQTFCGDEPSVKEPLPGFGHCSFVVISASKN